MQLPFRPRGFYVTPAELDPSDYLAAPAQVSAYGEVVDLLDALDAAVTTEQLLGVQRRLVERLHDAGEAVQQANRDVKRVTRGKAALRFPNDPEFERDLWRRIHSQYQFVGDALVWRQLNFDRRYIQACGVNELPGPITGKAGFPHELAVVEAAWAEQGRFAVLHDLTHCLRIGDVTIFGEDPLHPRELKLSPTAEPRPRQKRRLTRAEGILTGTEYLADFDDSRMQGYRSTVPLRTRMDALELVLEEAGRTGVAGERLSRAWALFGYVHPMIHAGDCPTPRQWKALSATTRTKARLQRPPNDVIGVTVSGANLINVQLAPPSIYPLSSRLRAALICDYAAFRSEMSLGLLIAALRDNGLTAKRVPGALGRSTDDSLQMDLPRGVRLGVRVGGLAQLAAELVQPRVWARAMAEAATHLPFEQLRRDAIGGTVLTLADEHKVWR